MIFSYVALAANTAHGCTSSQNGEILIISEQVAQIVTLNDDDAPLNVEHYPFEFHFNHQLCMVDGTCRALLSEFDDGKKYFWTPSIDHPQFYHLNNESNMVISSESELHGENCFNFFPISDQFIGALCLHTTPVEHLVVPYKINVSNSDVRDYRLGFELHINVDDHSPFITLNDDRAPVVLYVTYAAHLSAYKLVVIRYYSEDYVIIDIPVGCTHPRDLQPVGEYDALIRCENGTLLYYNGDNLALSKLPNGNIEIVSSCVNSSSFILVQDMNNIFFNDSRSGEVYVISINTNEVEPPLHTITSAVCYCNEGSVDFYFTAYGESSNIYRINLDDIITTKNENSTIPKVFEAATLQSNVRASYKLYIDMSILWGKQTRSENDERIFLYDLATQKKGRASINGASLAFVLQYSAPQCVTPIIDVIPPNRAESESKSSGQNDTYVSILAPIAAAFILISAIIVIAIMIIIIRHRRKIRQRLFL